MLVNMTEHATSEEIEHVVARIKSFNYESHVSRRAGRTVIGVPLGGGGREARELDALKDAPGVEEIQLPDQPFALASRRSGHERSVVRVGDVRIGGGEVIVIAGPCLVESRAQLFETARAVRAAGASMLRGGAYKPRTSPYDFQGLGVEALKLLREAGAETGLPVVTEVLGTEDVEIVTEYADMLQVGARNMQNFS
ncbi:MAG TPA: hypothetical protein VGA87_04560, partial [Pyrinomonadaceae bacterium]